MVLDLAGTVLGGVVVSGVSEDIGAGFGDVTLTGDTLGFGGDTLGRALGGETSFDGAGEVGTLLLANLFTLFFFIVASS